MRILQKDTKGIWGNRKVVFPVAGSVHDLKRSFTCWFYLHWAPGTKKMRLFWTCFCCIQHHNQTILCLRWSLWPMPPIPMSNQHVKRGKVMSFIPFCSIFAGWDLYLYLDEWLDLNPGLQKSIEQWTTPRAWHSQHEGAVISACGLHGLRVRVEQKGPFTCMAALHWLYMVNIIHWYSSQASFGSQTTDFLITFVHGAEFYITLMGRNRNNNFVSRLSITNKKKRISGQAVPNLPWQRAGRNRSPGNIITYNYCFFVFFRCIHPPYGGWKKSCTSS